MSGLGRGASATEAQGLSVLDEFKRVLKSFKRPSVIHKPDREFILVNRLLAWFRSASANAPDTTNAGCLLWAVYGSETRPNQINNLLSAMKPGKGCWLKVFAILLQLEKGHLVELFYRDRMLDRSLPISETDLRDYARQQTGLLSEGEEHSNFATRFNKLQHQLLTQDALDIENGRIRPHFILPVCTREPVKDNNQKIFQIEVPLECVPEKIIKRIKTKPHWKGDKDGEVRLTGELYSVKTDILAGLPRICLESSPKRTGLRARSKGL